MYCLLIVFFFFLFCFLFFCSVLFFYILFCKHFNPIKAGELLARRWFTESESEGKHRTEEIEERMKEGRVTRQQKMVIVVAFKYLNISVIMEVSKSKGVQQ